MKYLVFVASVLVVINISVYPMFETCNEKIFWTRYFSLNLYLYAILIEAKYKLSFLTLLSWVGMLYLAVDMDLKYEIYFVSIGTSLLLTAHFVFFLWKISKKTNN